MPRKGPAPKRPVIVDPVYQSQLVTQLVNKVLVDGKRSIAGLTLSSARLSVTTGSVPPVLSRQPSRAP